MSIKVVCCLYYQFLHAKQPWRKLVSGFSFACNKYPLQFTMTRAMTAQWRKESHWMCFIIFLLIWKGIQTSHSKISRPWRVKSLGFVCSPSFFSLPAESRLSCVVCFSRVLAFRSLYYPWGKMGTTRSLWHSQGEKELKYQRVVLVKLWFVVMFGVNTCTTQIGVIVIETSRNYKICSY